MASLGQSLVRLAAAALKSVAAGPARARRSVRGRIAEPERPFPPRRKAAGGRKPHPPGPAPATSTHYDPQPGNTADPGEIVWTWVPYEEDPSLGKDRPVLVIGREDGALLALMLTSRDRNNAGSRHDGYVDIGSGAWDRQGRPSEVYLGRLLRVDPDDVRRIGATLERPLFDRVLSRLEGSAGK